jgi:hypothetical protein
MKKLLVFFWFLFLTTSLFAQRSTAYLAEQLGLPDDTRFLVVHGDDLGVTHSKNVASINAYDEIIRNLVPGLNELVVHLAYDNEEMRATTSGHTHWYESAWRQRDYDYVVSQRFRDLLRNEEIRLITWSEIRELMYPDRSGN